MTILERKKEELQKAKQQKEITTKAFEKFVDMLDALEREKEWYSTENEQGEKVPPTEESKWQYTEYKAIEYIMENISVKGL